MTELRVNIHWKAGAVTRFTTTEYDLAFFIAQYATSMTAIRKITIK